MDLVLLWVVFGIFSAILAKQKNRSQVNWFLIGLLLGPFGLLVGVMKPLDENGNEVTNLNESQTKQIKYDFNKETGKFLTYDSASGKGVLLLSNGKKMDFDIHMWEDNEIIPEVGMQNIKILIVKDKPFIVSDNYNIDDIQEQVILEQEQKKKAEEEDKRIKQILAASASKRNWIILAVVVAWLLISFVNIILRKPY